MLWSGPINPQSTASGLSPNATFVNSAALDTMGGEPPFAARVRSKVKFTNADIGSCPAPYTVNRPLMPSVGNAAVLALS
jgi:hypothetical protein